jgi:hypothetical protein
MTERSTSPPPRLVPERPLPPYAYLPGLTPHPTRDPEGHSYGAEPELPAPPDPEDWRACGDYLYGIDLFNHGFYWEAHEAWEGLWVACGRRGQMATYLQALINLAAAGFKARWGNAGGMRANAKTALGLFKAAGTPPGPDGARYLGLDVRALGDYADRISRSPRTTETVSGEDSRAVFDLVLWPD